MGAKNSLKQDWRTTKPTTTIIVPTFNEADNVLLLVGRIRLALSGRPAEILFIDDSYDLNTVKVIIAARSLFRTPNFHIRMFHRTGAARRGGLSGAVTDGIIRARASQIIVMDGDLQHPPETLPSMIEAAESQDADVIVASRYCSGGSANGLDGGVRHMVSRGSTMLAKAFFPNRLKNVSDPMTGFFLFKRSAVDLDLLRPKGFKILLEILARHRNLKVAEVPFSFAERAAGQSKGNIKQGLVYFGQLALLKHANTKDAFTNLPRFVQFSAIGGGVFAVGMAILYVMVDVFGSSPLLANGVQLVVTFLLNYVLNKNITWRDRTLSSGAITKFITSRAATSVLNYYLFAWLIGQQFTLTLFGQAYDFTVHYLVANIIGLMVIMVLNFVFSDRWAFAEERVKSKAAKKSAALRWAFFAKLGGALAVAVIAASFFIQFHLALAIAMATIGVAMFVQASMETWRMTYAYRDPEAVSRLRFPDAKAPKEKFLMIVPARHEEEVLDATLLQLAKQTHPNVDIITVICDDDEGTLNVAYRAAAEEARIKVVQYPLAAGVKPNKPLQLNYVLETVAEQDYTIIGIVDAEDNVHPELLAHVDTAFNDKKTGVVQGGVQLMNHDSSWYSLHNVLEYYKWFNSAMSFQSDNHFMPLGGNTIFIRHKLLKKAGGWPATLTEDCSLGVLLSVRFKTKTAVYYDPRLATQEETPDSLKSLFKQRVRWCQGFYHEWRKGLWRRLPTLRQRMLAGYVLAGPAMLAFSTVMVLITLVAMAQLKAPVVLVMLMFIPLIPMVLLIALNAVFLYDFGKAFNRKVTLRQYATLFATFVLYQMVLNLAGLWSMVRELRGDTTWHKTSHTGRHRGTGITTTPSTPALLMEKA